MKKHAVEIDSNIKQHVFDELPVDLDIAVEHSLSLRVSHDALVKLPGIATRMVQNQAAVQILCLVSDAQLERR